MAKLTIFHNPRCSKSREALKLIQDNHCDHSIFLYLEANLKKSDIKNVIRILNISPRDLLRKSEEAYKLNNLKNESYSNEQLIDVMIKYPKLIERPIIIKGDQAVIGRPPEKVLDLIK